MTNPAPTPSTMPCADQPRLLPYPCRIGSPLTPTSPRSITSLKARRAHQLSATQASLQPLPAGAAVTGPASQYVVSQQATGIERATPTFNTLGLNQFSRFADSMYLTIAFGALPALTSTASLADCTAVARS